MQANRYNLESALFCRPLGVMSIYFLLSYNKKEKKNKKGK